MESKFKETQRKSSQVKFLIPIIQRAANTVQAKSVCVSAGRCGDAPPFFSASCWADFRIIPLLLLV
jgi:hypothetical protein